MSPSQHLHIINTLLEGKAGCMDAYTATLLHLALENQQILGKCSSVGAIAETAELVVSMVDMLSECYAGQGLCLAIEDATVLAWHLKQQGFTPQALRRYTHEASCVTCHNLLAVQAPAAVWFCV